MSASLDKSRSRSRRAKALWTLWTILAYLISALILVLVIGPQNWGLPHYGGLVGGPILIYGVRKSITAVFGWSIARQQAHVDRLQKEREKKIAELKKATRYDSTQELLQKYGGAPPTPKAEESKQNMKGKGNDSSHKPQQNVQRTGIPPPPTANIPSRAPAVQPIRPPSRNGTLSPPQSPQNLVQSPVTTDEPGFAPNAFSQPHPTSTSYEVERHWYDRVFDLVLGEDETLAKNRLVLICQNCRLVNGQAPPGVKTLEELGRWRCQSCGTMNGIQAEAAQVVKEMTQRQPTISVSEPVNETEAEAELKSELLDDKDGSTGRDQENKDSGISRRVTRSTGKPEVEGL